MEREQFPNVHDEYTYLKSTMTNTDGCFSDFFYKRDLKYDSNVVSDVNMVPVSYEFIDIQGVLKRVDL
jgi:putative ABC transport system permease protein